MTYLIGGHAHGQSADQKDLDLKSSCIVAPYGPRTGMQRPTEFYNRTQVSFHGEVKTFYILSSKKPIELRDEILEFWDQVKTDVYSI
ncbi:hypothetical protein [Acinetobacter pittii]|uniref:hypothetical protein n=1 Tax=Acinetobacter pittii TaxID=48296 RepID=UPI002A7476B8|nr:hypothetical protein [Acinetobacter pittii]WPP87492.1 hypothetical protein SOI77_14075 [Acinetobacter pittii]